MDQLWKNYWSMIVPGIFFVLAILFTVLEKGDVPLARKFPKVRTWFLFGMTVALYQLWSGVGMFFWEMGLRPVLLGLFVVFAVLFVLHLKRSRKSAGRNTMRWISYLFLNLIPGWFLGTLLAGVFQTMYFRGMEGVSQSMVKLVSQGLLLAAVIGGIILFVKSGDAPGNPGTGDKSAAEEVREFAAEHRREKIAELNEMIRYRNERARFGGDVSDLDRQIADMKRYLNIR